MVTPLRAPEAALFDVVAPSDGRVVDVVYSDGAADVAESVRRLRAAQPAWAELTVSERVRWLGRFRDWLMAHEHDIAELLAAETGKPAAETGVELASSLSVLRYYSHHAKAFLADGHPRPTSVLTAMKKLRVRQVPYPVVGIISPWNFPIAMALWDAFPALLAGSAVLLKPSEHTPLATNAIVAGWAEIAAPPVLGCVNGAAATGTAVVDEVDYVQFTGSTRTGTAIAVRAAAALKPYSLELGGNDPAIVLADADLELTASGIVFNALLNSGQMCVAVERVYVATEVHDAFVDLLVGKVERLRSTGADHRRDLGSLITEEQLRIVDAHVDDALAKGARCRTGGRAGPGRQYAPTVLTEVDHTMDVMTKETFGPVIAVMRVRDADEAVRWANDSEYGLSASVWSRDHEAAMRVAERLEVGTVDINDAATHILCHPIPQSGWKSSGVGARLGGAAGIRKFTRSQAFTRNRVDLPLVTKLAGFPYSAGKSRLLASAWRLTDGSGLRQRLGLGRPRPKVVIEVRRRIGAPREQVYDWLLDSSHFARAMPAVRHRLLRRGADQQYGPGALRSIVSPLARFTEEVTAAEAPARIDYRIVESWPRLHHLGATIWIDPAPGGCDVVWRSELGGGGLARPAGIGLGFVFGRILRRCAVDLVGSA